MNGVFNVVELHTTLSLLFLEAYHGFALEILEIFLTAVRKRKQNKTNPPQTKTKHKTNQPTNQKTQPTNQKELQYLCFSTVEVTVAR